VDERFLRARIDYETVGLDRADLDPDPFTQLATWLHAAQQGGLPEPNTMIVATAGSDARPSARAVLLKGLDQRGLVFYTSYRSRKGNELAENPRAAACFVWLEHHRQVRVEGAVELVDEAESDAYFASRPRGAQLGAAASSQSDVVADRVTLDSAVARLVERTGEAEVGRPKWWGGYRIAPEVFEFWQGRSDRLHDRFRYRLDSGRWVVERLWP
jgi:pyridoxamine 5'-phosphate oxidase